MTLNENEAGDPLPQTLLLHKAHDLRMVVLLQSSAPSKNYHVSEVDSNIALHDQHHFERGRRLPHKVSSQKRKHQPFCHISGA